MPKVCLIANVGQRDLQLERHPIPSDRLRDKAAEIMAAFDEYRSRLSAPMLSAALERVRLDSGSGKVDAVVLVATDQTDEHYRNGDTEPAAQVIKKLLSAPAKNAPASIAVAPIHDAPNSYDRMLDVFRQEVVPRKHAKEAERIYVLCTGGTPACNTALLITSVEHYRERVTALYVSEKTGACTPLKVGAVLLDGYRRAAREHALAQYDFASIAPDATYPELARDIARAASARANFDFETLDQVIAGRYPDLEQLDARAAEHLLADTQRLRKEDARYLLRDLYWNARMRWHREEFADFLGRVWRVLEMAYQTLLCEATGIQLDGTPKSDTELAVWATHRPWLGERLAKRRIEPRQSMVAMEAMLDAIGDCDDACPAALRERIAAVLPPAHALQAARELRNKSVIAHGFKGLSRSVILEKLNLDEASMLQTIESVLTALSVDKGENPYEQFAALLRKADP